MKILLSCHQPQEDDFVWLARATIGTIALGPTCWLGITENESLAESADGRWTWIGSKDLTPFVQPVVDPVLLAQSTPSLLFDRKFGLVTLFAHPLGCGSFFYAPYEERTYLATSILDVCERYKQSNPNAVMIADFFTNLRNRGTCLTDTFVDGVSQIAPGSRADWRSDQLHHRSYWLPVDDEQNGTLNISQAAVLVRNSIEEVLRRDVSESTACLVSGGLDSSVVAGIAVKLNPSKVSLLTYGHDLDTVREKRLRDDLSRHLRVSIGTLPLSATGFNIDAVRRVNCGADSPSGGIFTGIFAEILTAAGEAGYDTVLTGEGGDEVFDPSPNLITDLIRARRLSPCLSALSYFSSCDQNISAFRLLRDYGAAPLAVTAKVPYPMPSGDAFIEEILGPDFRPALQAARVAARRDIAKASRDGWNLVTYYNYRQILDLKNYEAVDLTTTGRAVRVKSPLASIEVFRAANTLRLDQQAGPWLGFRPKRLLALAARDVLPYDVAYSPKTGVGNLLWQLVGRFGHGDGAELDLSVLSGIGIDVPARWLRPAEYPTQQALIWGFLLILSTWFCELKDAIDERHQIPHETRSIRYI